jgi:ABC-type lipoprotein export system ATPase subunit
MERVTVLRPDALGRERSILDGVSASLGEGRVTIVSGPTGSGKSTLLHLLGALIRPTQGTVLAGGEPISRWISAHRDRWRREVGLALQDPHLLEGLSALENVLVRGVRATARGSPTLGQHRRAALEALDSLDAGPLASRRVEGLSGGEQQRVALARSLVGGPRYLLWDEPTAHQDDMGVSLVAAALESARARGATVVVATHDPRLEQMGGLKVTELRLVGGRLVAAGTP